MSSTESGLQRSSSNDLIEQAQQLMKGPGEQSAQLSDAEKTLSQAYALIHPVVTQFQDAKLRGLAPDYAAYFRERRDEKIAALVLFVKQSLLEIQFSVINALDHSHVRILIATYIELLYNIQAIHALILLYDFAIEQRQQSSLALWKNVGDRCLDLMARLEDCRTTMLLFLHERQDTLTHIAGLLNTVEAEKILALHQIFSLYQTISTQQWQQWQTVQMPVPSYIAQVRGQQEMILQTAGSQCALASFIQVKDRIQEAAATGDLATLMHWVRDGSPLAMREALRQARIAMALPQYIDLLKRLVFLERMDEVRTVVVLLELGNLNRNQNLPAGHDDINQILSRVAMTSLEESRTIAQVAINELVSVKAYRVLLAIAEHAPTLTVAEDALYGLADLRRLDLSNSLMQQRPELVPCFRRLREELQYLLSLVDSASGSSDAEVAQVYIDRLCQVNAIPELQMLAKQTNDVGNLAVKALAAIDPSLAIDYYDASMR